MYNKYSIYNNMSVQKARIFVVFGASDVRSYYINYKNTRIRIGIYEQVKWSLWTINVPAIFDLGVWSMIQSKRIGVSADQQICLLAKPGKRSIRSAGTPSWLRFLVWRPALFTCRLSLSIISKNTLYEKKKRP